VVSSGDLIAATLAWAQELTATAPLTMRYVKQVLNFAMEENVGATILAEANLQRICGASEDLREGIKAFREKHNAIWKGR